MVRLRQNRWVGVTLLSAKKLQLQNVYVERKML